MTATLEELEQRVQALEAAQQADQLVSGAYSINAQGQLEAKLTGKLEATGIVFAEGAPVEPGEEETLNEIQWQRSGAWFERITAFEVNTEEIKGKSLIEHILLAQSSAFGQNAYLALVAKRREPAPAGSAVLALAGTGLGAAASATIMDNNGRSNFVQTGFAEPVRLRMQWGIYSVPGFGGGSWSFEVPLAQPWGIEHVLFLAGNAVNTSENKAWLTGGEPAGLSHGKIKGPSGPDFEGAEVPWISIGY